MHTLRQFRLDDDDENVMRRLDNLHVEIDQQLRIKDELAGDKSKYKNRS